jgi:UDP-N-acetylmuramate dehydrogenase
MMPEIQETGLRGILKHSEPMSRHTSWRVGGPADRFYLPADVEDLSAFLRQLPEGESLVWVGLGSNLLVRDAGIRGTVICTNGLLSEMECIDAHTVRIEAGVACPKAARFCARNGLAGAEFLAGIPGTIGGALAMNAGAFGGETWSLVASVETLDARGEHHVRMPSEYAIGYRQISGPGNEWFVAARFRLTSGDSEASLGRIKELLARRGESQPVSQPSCGSVFRNPEGDFAARLIEASDLKGTCIGGACVSDKHANFIINTGNATAAEIEQLIQKVAETVKQKQGIILVPEVHIVGDDGIVAQGN